jgi:Mn2+/Fe2+ NRAMP family transporter
MVSILTAAHRGPARRLLYAAFSAVLLSALVVALARHGGYGQLLLFALAPDLPMLAGAGSGLEPGQLHPRAVPAYNAAHRLVWPAAGGALIVAGVIPSWLAVGVLTWALHITLDRAIGYGLRTGDGYQRA